MKGKGAPAGAWSGAAGCHRKGGSSVLLTSAEADRKGTTEGGQVKSLLRRKKEGLSLPTAAKGPNNYEKAIFNEDELT